MHTFAREIFINQCLVEKKGNQTIIANLTNQSIIYEENLRIN